MHWYLDGSLYVVVRTEGAKHRVEIGIGGNPEDAIVNLREIALQNVGRDRGLSDALQWVHNTGWVISAPNCLKAIEAPKR